jgi:hypothetical protein
MPKAMTSPWATRVTNALSLGFGVADRLSSFNTAGSTLNAPDDCTLVATNLYLFISRLAAIRIPFRDFSRRSTRVPEILRRPSGDQERSGTSGNNRQYRTVQQEKPLVPRGRCFIPIESLLFPWSG